MLLQTTPPTNDVGRTVDTRCAALEAVAEPFGDEHPHAEAWALHLAAEACLAAGSADLTVIAVSHGLREHRCARCRDAFLRLGAKALILMREEA